MTELHPLLNNIDPRSLICLDAEFADGVHMLELSVSDCTGQVIYFRRFRPVKITAWDAYPHGITPAMVANEATFAECVADIQAIIDHADYITGFALNNDFRRLSAEGVRIPADKKVIELRDWFWTLYGLDHGLDYVKGISNQSVAETLGIEVDADRLHGSEYDIFLSLSSLNRLLHLSSGIEAAGFDDFYSVVNERFKVNKEQYDREHSAGYCYIQRRANGYWVKCTARKPERESQLVAMIEVESRKEAMIHISQLFLNHITEGSFFVEKISAGKLEKFKAYSNKFSAEDKAIYSKLLRLADKFNK